VALLGAADPAPRPRGVTLVSAIAAVIRFDTPPAVPEPRVLMTAPDGMILTEDGRILDSNERIAEALGRTVESLRARDWSTSWRRRRPTKSACGSITTSSSHTWPICSIAKGAFCHSKVAAPPHARPPQVARAHAQGSVRA
jgi:hypothetical protein